MGAFLGYDSDGSMLLFKVTFFLIAVSSFCFCFFGYKIKRFFISISTGLFFAIVTFFILLSQMGYGDEIMPVILWSLLLGALGFTIGFALYRVMAIVYAGCFGFALGYIVGLLLGETGASYGMESVSGPGIVFGLFFAAFSAYLMAKFMIPAFIVITALQGGFGLVSAVKTLLGYEGFIDYIRYSLYSVVESENGKGQVLLALLLSLIGCLFQFATAKYKLSETKEALHHFSAKVQGSVPNAEQLDGLRSLLYTPIRLVDISNMPLFLLGGAACALFGFSKYMHPISMLTTLLLVAVPALLFAAYRGIKLSPLILNASMLLLMLLSALKLLFVTRTLMGSLIVISVFLVALGYYLLYSKRLEQRACFLASALSAGIACILFLVEDIFSVHVLAPLVLSLPFLLPFVKGYATKVNVSVVSKTQAVPAQEVKQENVSQQEAVEGDKRYCAQCGQALPANSRFCTACGTALKEQSVN